MSYISYYSTSVGAGYWLSTLEETVSHKAIEVNGSAIDADNHVYMCGMFYPAGSATGYIAKFDTDGALLLDVKVEDATPNYSVLTDVTLDSTDNPYVVGINSPLAGNDGLAIKFNASEVIQWQRNENMAGGDTEYFGVGLALDGNVYVAGRVNQGGNLDIAVVKFSDTGSLLWDKYLRAGSGVSYMGGMQILVNSRDQVCIAADMNTSTTNAVGVIQLENDGALNWQRKLSVPGGYAATIYNMVCDNDDNIYIVGSFELITGYGVYLVKYNYLGAIQWQRRLGGIGEQTATSVALDADQNPYVSGYDAGKTFVAKYNPAGTLQWQRNIDGLYPAYAPEVWTRRNTALAFDSDDAMYVAATMRNPSSPYQGKTLLAKLPNDGSLTGVYGEYTYSVATLTDAAGVMTDAAGTTGFVTRTSTDTAGAYIASDTTMSASVQQLT